MNFRVKLIASALAIALAAGIGAGATLAASTGHEGHQAAQIELTLNNGVKWQGDENMIKGMDSIRGALTPRIEAIHTGTLPADDFKSLAAEVQTQVDFMVANCKLTPEVDEQFHMVLGQVLDGVADIEKGADQRGGAVKIVTALNAYGDYFEHPGWKALE